MFTVEDLTLAENETAVSTVISYFQVFYGRQPDLAGLQFWAFQLSEGNFTLNTLADEFAEASEFNAQFGDRTTTEIVFAQFRNVLGREPDFAGLTFWTDQVNDGNITIADLGRFFATSPEFQDRAEDEIGQLLANIEAGEGTDPTVSLFDIDVVVEGPIAVGGGVATGAAGDDVFVGASLSSGLDVDGGAGNDTIIVSASEGFGGSPQLTSVENVVITAQNTGGIGGNDNNVSNNAGSASFDAGRIEGTTRFENYDSRSDLIIEDARDDDDVDGTFTADLTLAVVSTDPGNVDTVIYYDNPVNVSTTDTTGDITFTVLDQEAALTFNGVPDSATTGLLTELAITSFRFSLDGQDVEVELPVTDAFGPNFSFEDLADLILTATTAELTELGLEDSIQGVAFGEPVLIGAANQPTVPIILQFANAVPTIDPLDNISFSSVDQNGNNASDPAVELSAGVVTVVVEDLISLNIQLDDVGKSSTGGDLVAGATSTGRQTGTGTSDSLGIQQFDIEVDRSSNLQTINSTNNSLEVVNISNGENDGPNNTTTASDEIAGDLTVRGDANNFSFASQGPSGSNGNDLFTGAETQQNEFGFSDVRVINAAGFQGDLDLTAELTSDIIAKYSSIDDTGFTGDEDDIDLDYDLGAGNDEFFLNTEGGALLDIGTASREDFNYNINGRGGDDVIVTNIGEATQLLDAQGQDYYQLFTDGSFYANQANNDAASITVVGGAGNDSIWTHGFGDAVIIAGTGSDIVYSDNSGVAQLANTLFTSGTLTRNNIGDEANQIDYVVGAVWTFNDDNGTTTSIGPVTDISGSTNTNLTVGQTTARVLGNIHETRVTVSFEGAGGTATSGYESTVTLPDTVDGVITEQELNQAIKLAVNNDPVLSSVLEAVDGPGQSLAVYTRIDGDFDVNDFTISVEEVVTTSTGTSTTTPFPQVTYDATSASTDFQNFGNASFAESDNTIVIGNDTSSVENPDVTVLSTNDFALNPTAGAVLNGASNEILRVNDGNFGREVVFNFDAGNSGVGAGGEDAFDFQFIARTAANSSAANFANGAVNTVDNSVSVFTAPVVTTNVAPLGVITAAEIADLYDLAAPATPATATTSHVAILYDADNVGRVFNVTDTAGANNAVAVEVGQIELVGTDFATLTFDNFI